MGQGSLAVRLYAGGALAAVCAAVVASTLSVPPVWLGLPATIAIYLAYRACRSGIEQERGKAQQISELHLATIEALALAIDAKDQTEPNHIQRVQAYATGLARALGMPETEVEAVKTAALLHDIGKLAIPDHILAKPGPLTPDEFQRVRLHPEVGAAILHAVPFPSPVAPLILSHHERWDGRGYPAGLKENEIPLGARVVGVVEYFDALTSDRPYHKAISQDAALALLRQEAGKALDPRVVEIFTDILPKLAGAFSPVQSRAVKKTAPRLQTGEGLRTIAAAGHRPRASVFDDIADANREIYALYEIAQTMGTTLAITDTMALVSSKLSQVVPFSACALFLYSEQSEQLHCRFATGTDSELIQQLTLRSGQGLTGWVARNRRPLINARPSADLEAMGSNAPTVLQSALVCPLIYSDRLIGTLAVYHTDPGFYGEDHARLLERVCEQAAAVIHNAVVFEQTQEESLTDPLTGLPNTRWLFQQLTRELARAERLSTQLSLVIMDLDGFKFINDTYGHRVGDWALQKVARVLSATIRNYDTCVRYGGDEFIVVLSGCGSEEAEAKRIELQNAVRRVVLEVESGRLLPLSISAGLAVFPDDGNTYEALLGQADRRMYHDKNSRKVDPQRGIEPDARAV
jgi:diguanylate cyclase (GGDEF)-like protein/putative nucleotidyltransferase with HDIG domain